MSQKRVSVYTVNTSDWMKYRPYQRFSPQYDAFYLRLANEVFSILGSADLQMSNLFTRAQLIELSVVLSSWFEDYANEIGIWAAFVRKNQERYGYALPFYALEAYDPESINPEDIAYLTWHYCVKSSGRMIHPLSPALFMLGERCADLFEAALEEAPGTDFYEDYLRFSEDIPFFELKTKLTWMALKNYLNGPEMTAELQTALEESLQDENMAEVFARQSGILKYTLQNDFIFRKSGSWLGINIPEWLCLVARCPETLHPHILGLSHFFSELFLLESLGTHTHRLRCIATERVFEVRQESADFHDFEPGEILFTSLAPWKSEWWVTGMLSSYGREERALRPQDRAQAPFYAFDTDRQEQMRLEERNQERGFLEFHGDRMAFFKNKAELNEAIVSQNKHYNDTLNKAGKTRKEDEKRIKDLARKFEDNLDFLDSKLSLGMFYEPGEGFVVSSVLPQIAALMQKKHLTTDEQRNLFYTFFKECSPAMVDWFIDKYGDQNLVFPFPSPLPLSGHIEFFNRFFNPEGFREKQPRIRLV